MERSRPELAWALLDATNEGLAAVAPDGRILSWNRAAEAVVGRRAGEVIGRPLVELVASAEDLPLVEAAFHTALQSGRAMQRAICRRDTGEPVFVLFVMNATKDERGAPLVALTVRELVGARKGGGPTEGVQADFRGLLEAAPDAMLVVAEDGRILVANAQAEALFGYSRSELLGKRIEQLIPARFRVAHPRFRAGYMESPRRRPMGAGLDLYALRSDGSEFPAEISLSPMESDAGVVITAAVRDVTDRRRLEELRREALEAENRRIVEASRMKSEFLANMSHELRTPLNAIIGFAELMHDEKVGPISDEQKEYLGDVLTSARHLLQLINDVLDLAKVEAGKMEFRAEPVDLGKLVGEVRDILRTLSAKKRIHVECDVDPSLTGLVLDASKLKQVLYNYLSNALKFTPDGGRVTVRARPESDESFCLEVEDTGIGIRPEELGLLFQEFKQLDATSAKKFQGTGLGLSLTKRIVEAQGGDVGVRSTYGEGSTFFAILPRRAPEGREVEPPRSTARLRVNFPTVLVIDDEPADRAIIAGALTELGYRVETAATGADAVARCDERLYDAITLDLVLPDMSGWDVLKAIRASGLNRETPTIVVTVVPDRALAAIYPIQDYLVKPAEPRAIETALRRSRVLPGEGRPILVVDDDPAVRKVVERTLQQEGYRCVARSDGESGLEAAEAEPPAAVVLDLLMPGMDGFEFLERFRLTAAGRHTPVIVWTSKDLGADERARLLRSAHAVLSKGEAGPAPLVAQLREHLPRPAASAESAREPAAAGAPGGRGHGR